jgi:hypothetical protein
VITCTYFRYYDDYDLAQDARAYLRGIAIARRFGTTSAQMDVGHPELIAGLRG